MIDPNLHCWKHNLVKELFNPPLAQAILSTPILTRPSPDKLIWTPDPKCNFSVKSTYHSSCSHIAPLPTCGISWNKLWNLNLPERLKMLIWRIGFNFLPAKENLLNHLQVSDVYCLFCKGCIESSSHLFFNCPAIRSFWFAVCWGPRTDSLAISQSEDIIVLFKPPNFPL